MKVLIACEESQRVCVEFRRLGHEAYSCDVQEPSGGHPEWHILGDCLEVIEGGTVRTMDDVAHEIGRWDLMIAHPPCTYLSNVATRHYSLKCTSAEKVVARLRKQEEAIVFFMRMMYAPVPKIAVENPVGIMNTIFRKPDQIIHPWYFSDGESDTENFEKKATCYWLKGLQPLKYSKPSEEPQPKVIYASGKAGYFEETSKGRNGKTRSKTFPAVARAMAEQWGQNDDEEA